MAMGSLTTQRPRQPQAKAGRIHSHIPPGEWRLFFDIRRVLQALLDLRDAYPDKDAVPKQQTEHWIASVEAVYVLSYENTCPFLSALRNIYAKPIIIYSTATPTGVAQRYNKCLFLRV